MYYELIVVGASLGGLSALKALLIEIPKGYPIPFVVVQHRGKDVDDGLCEELQRYSKLTITEAEDKQEISSGFVYLAPPNYHLMVESRGSFALSTEGPVAFARPAIDVLFQSASNAYRERLIAIVLTGASKDGAEGVKMIKTHGGLVIVQQPETAESKVMPLAAINATTVDFIANVDEIGRLLVKITI